MLKRVIVVAILGAALLLLTSIGIAIGGGKITILGGLFASLVVVIWTAGRKPAAVIRRGTLAAVFLVAIAALPVDVRFVASGYAGVQVGPAIWGPITPESVASAPPNAFFMGRCIVPAHPIRYVISVSF